MAQINFPVANPNGQEFEADNGVIYTYGGALEDFNGRNMYQDEGLDTLGNRYLKLDARTTTFTSNFQVTGSIQCWLIQKRLLNKASCYGGAVRAANGGANSV